MLYNILRNRLKQRVNKNFVKWRAEKKLNKRNELHHWLGSFLGGKKQNDYFLAEISPTLHKILHYDKSRMDLMEKNEIDFLINTIEDMADYIEYLQEKK